jgi:hypothetical protein
MLATVTISVTLYVSALLGPADRPSATIMASGTVLDVVPGRYLVKPEDGELAPLAKTSGQPPLRARYGQTGAIFYRTMYDRTYG